MDFALVNFYKQNTCNIIPYSDTILNDEQKKQIDRTRWNWIIDFNCVERTKGKSTTAAAEIIRILG